MTRPQTKFDAEMGTEPRNNEREVSCTGPDRMGIAAAKVYEVDKN